MIDDEGAEPDLAAHGGEQIVDTRLDSGQSCAQLATDAVHGLAPGSSFVLVSDHDPIAINYLLRAELPGRTSWDVLESGPDRWQVRIGTPHPTATGPRGREG